MTYTRQAKRYQRLRRRTISPFVHYARNRGIVGLVARSNVRQGQCQAPGELAGVFSGHNRLVVLDSDVRLIAET